MVFEVKDINEIKLLTDSEIMNYILESSRQTKEFIVKKEKVDGDLRFNLSINIDEIKHAFDFNHANRIYTFPYMDERELCNKNLNGGRKVPAKGFFWVIDAEVNKKELGLVEVVFSIGKMIRIPNDTRYLRYDKPEFYEIRNFYYDYEDEKYIQVPSDFKKRKKGSKKSSKSDIKIQEFERRMEALAEVYRRLGKLEEEYGERVDAAGRNLKEKDYKAHNLRKLIVYFLEFESYLEEFFRVKLLFSHIDLREYNLLVEYMKTLKKQSQDTLDEINNICFEFKDKRLNFTDPKYHHEKKIIDLQRNFYHLRKKLFEFVAAKDISEKGAFENSSGYIKYKDEFFPSLGTIELRRSLTDIANREVEWKEFENKLYGKSP